MKNLQELKDALSNGKNITHNGFQVAQVDFLSMNMGGDIKIRLVGNLKHIKVSIFDIKIDTEIKK